MATASPSRPIPILPFQVADTNRPLILTRVFMQHVKAATEHTKDCFAARLEIWRQVASVIFAPTSGLPPHTKPKQT